LESGGSDRSDIARRPAATQNADKVQQGARGLDQSEHERAVAASCAFIATPGTCARTSLALEPNTSSDRWDRSLPGAARKCPRVTTPRPPLEVQLLNWRRNARTYVVYLASLRLVALSSVMSNTAPLCSLAHGWLREWSLTVADRTSFRSASCGVGWHSRRCANQRQYPPSLAAVPRGS
jgi:hypothetical protein